MPTRLSFAAILLALPCSAAVIGMSTAAQPLTAERVASLPRAQRAPWLQYLERSHRQAQADHASLAAELKSAGLAEPLVPPSGSSARSLPLNRPAEWYASDEARTLADHVVSFQTPAGGWSKNLNLSEHARRPGESFAPDNRSRYLSPDDFDTPHDPHWNYVGTLDNDATITELRFLAKVATTAPSYRKSFSHGLEYLFNAQFPNGGWPQVWPLEGGYHDAITFNDSAVTGTLELLEAVAMGDGDYAFVPAALRRRAHQSVDRAIHCIVAAQIVSGSHRTVWGQQHDALTLQPVAGRYYEPAALCSSESAGILIFLMSLPKPSAEVAAAVRAGTAWIEKAVITGKSYTRGPNGRQLFELPGAEPLWARYYEIGTNRPIFGDRDKTIRDNVSEISRERRDGYSWYTGGPKQALERYATWYVRADPAHLP